MNRPPAHHRRLPLLVPLLALLLAAGPLLLAPRPVLAAATFTVTTTGDEPDLLLTDPVCDVSPDEGDQCTLRAAIQEANATPGPDTIAFNIPGGGLQTIRPASQLPTIERKVALDGYTQPGASPNTAAVGTNALLRIELDGSNGGFDGLRIAGANTLVRGLVINRFRDDGIDIGGGATGVRIAGCFVGTDAAGTAARGNDIGIAVNAAGVQIGGSGPAARNLLSGNDRDGVVLYAAARVLGNLIGTDRSGAGRLGNGQEGVDAESGSTTIGGADAAQANVIAFNGDGVGVSSSATGVRILRNSIFANDGLGIDLGFDGPTANDIAAPPDADDGANTLQNFPLLEDAASSRVTGLLQSTPNQDFVIRLFSNPGAGDEGKVFEEGPLVVTTDNNGTATFTFFPDPPIPAGRSVTATATNQEGNTSEFSANVAVT